MSVFLCRVSGREKARSAYFERKIYQPVFRSWWLWSYRWPKVGNDIRNHYCKSTVTFTANACHSIIVKSTVNVTAISCIVNTIHILMCKWKVQIWFMWSEVFTMFLTISLLRYDAMLTGNLLLTFDYSEYRGSKKLANHQWKITHAGSSIRCMSVNSTKNCFLRDTLAWELILIFINSSWVANGIALNEVNKVRAVKMASVYLTPQ